MDKEFEKEDEINTSGWDAITEAFEKVYPAQTDPKHYGTLVPWRLGGDIPLDGVSIYETDDYYHFVTYGLSELYEKESEDPEWSGYGMEFTMKLKKSSIDKNETEEELKCAVNNLIEIAKITFDRGELFLPDEYIYTGSTSGIDLHNESALTGFIMIADTDVPPINTLNGKVEFVEFIGCTDKELKLLVDKKIKVQELYALIGSDVTDLKRNSVI